MSAADWTEERVNQLKVLWTQGFSASQIAKQIGGGVTRNAVIGKRIRMGLPDRASPNREYTRKPRPANQRPTNIAAAKQPKIKAPSLPPAPWKEKGGRAGPNNVRFIDRQADQCPMFLSGQDGAEGFVCGDPVFSGSWCGVCGKLIYTPSRAPITAPRAA